MVERSSIFDMIGPVMIGPSSSHTAGAVRLGRVARKILGEIPEKATITFYNSFARTYEGHGSDRAVVAGLLDYKIDDPRIKHVLDDARQLKMDFQFKSISSYPLYHPNTISIKAQYADKVIDLRGQSTGGGIIQVREVNGFDANFSASLHTLIIEAKDIRGSISFIAEIISNDDCNIATMTVSRKSKNDVACLILEMDSKIESITLEYLNKRNWIHCSTYIPNIDN